MPVRISFVPGLGSDSGSTVAESRESVSAYRVVVLIGNRADLVANSEKVLSSLSLASQHALFSKSVENASVSDFTGGTASISTQNDAGGITKIGALIIPTASSRHNTPMRGDVITEHISSLANISRPKEEKKTQIVVAKCVVLVSKNVRPHDALVNASASIARSFPIYTRKGNRTEEDTTLALQVSFLSSENCAPLFPTDAQLSNASIIADGVRKAAALVDMPTNELNVTTFVETVQKSLAALQSGYPDQNVAIEVISGQELERRGFGGIYGVGKAATHPPAFVILSNNPAQAKKTVVWAGKGIVYDTGGLSIKDRNSMPGMKRDMGGAAAMFYAFEAAVKARFSEKLYTLLCLAENSVGPIATRPDDVHQLYSGLTVEINNTDAEGRLVLGDGVAYASKHLSPSIIVDMCTLTGAQGIATGRKHAAIVCNQDDLEHQAILAGRSSGDLVHPLPYCPEFFTTEFSSTIADMKNSVKNRDNAQSSCAAQFIANHLCEYDGPWLHIDMAYPVHKGERGTGYGVALLLELFVFSPNQ